MGESLDFTLFSTYFPSIKQRISKVDSLRPNGIAKRLFSSPQGAHPCSSLSFIGTQKGQWDFIPTDLWLVMVVLDIIVHYINFSFILTFHEQLSHIILNFPYLYIRFKKISLVSTN